MAADIGLIGLAVMGQNLALNIHDHGYRVVVHNRGPARLRAFLEGPARGTGITGADTVAALAAALERPRRILLMVKAGEAVDAMIEQLVPHLELGDLIVDGGNSAFDHTTRRTRSLAERGILFLGTGISGGEEGARHGPSIMPGGNPEGWPLVREIFQAIAAQVDGVPCCEWVGPEGAGHYVKMVHNGIEYGDMQLIAEAAHLLRAGLGLDAARLAQVFGQWNAGPLASYLVEITARIFQVREADGVPRVERILDVAGQKGTGRWTVASALDLGVPLTLICEAVLARFLSSLKDARVRGAAVLGAPDARFTGDAEAAVRHVHDALYAAKIVSYAQGFMLMRAAAEAHGWGLDYGAISMLWRGGCIIRSRFLGNIRDAFARDPALESLMVDPFFASALRAAEPGWRRAVGLGVELGVPVPGLASALAFFDGYRSAELPANLLQAQRDYFGAHTYERTDRARGEHFHTDWSDGSERPA